MNGHCSLQEGHAAIRWRCHRALGHHCSWLIMSTLALYACMQRRTKKYIYVCVRPSLLGAHTIRVRYIKVSQANRGWLARLPRAHTLPTAACVGRSFCACVDCTNVCCVSLSNACTLYIARVKTYLATDSYNPLYLTLF